MDTLSEDWSTVPVRSEDLILEWDLSEIDKQ